MLSLKKHSQLSFKRFIHFDVSIHASRMLWIAVTTFLFLLTAAETVYAQDGEYTAVLTAVPAAGKITIDGSLREEDWDNAVPVDVFTQRELVEGAAASERTEVRVLYDKENLYIGVLCLDSDPGAIISKEQKRDSGMASDDSFSILIDTFMDRRSGYLFITNPNGTRYDALVKTGDMGASGDADESWNAVWDVASRIDDRGWKAEFVIPFKTLRFPSGKEQRWSINFRRKISRKNEDVLWTSWRQNEGLMQLSHTGTLEGIKGIERKRQAD